MTAEKVLAFRPREHHPDSVRQQRPSPEIPARLLVFPTWDPALDSMMAWAARQDLDTFLHWRRPPDAEQTPHSVRNSGADNQT
jgi:hypothetical protein